MGELAWFVAHVRARREKKLKQFCEGKGLLVKLPCYQSVRKYRGKVVTFSKPLFPGYVFLELLPDQKRVISENDSVARLLTVHNQEEFRSQLAEIFAALESGLEVFLAPEIGTGSRVKIKAGPLRGMEATVEERYGMTTVLLRLDFIGQAAAVRLQADELELS